MRIPTNRGRSLKLRDRVARLAPYSRWTRGLCTDAFHEADGDEQDRYITEPERFSSHFFHQYYRCPTCGFATSRRMPWLSVRLLDLRCALGGHRLVGAGVVLELVAEDGTTVTIKPDPACRCGARP